MATTEMIDMLTEAERRVAGDPEFRFSVEHVDQAFAVLRPRKRQSAAAGECLRAFQACP